MGIGLFVWKQSNVIVRNIISQNVLAANGDGITVQVRATIFTLPTSWRTIPYNNLVLDFYRSGWNLRSELPNHKLMHRRLRTFGLTIVNSPLI